ncbi:hypothetical protein D9623_04325 [Azospirillum brasilense]|uniref:Uncharacterized protein n=2 Tax=Azospirillaceae TaxID=2829815 RepID=A0A0P0F5E2_AZOBR|nr:hypothetical protein [Azospirillum brasilense]PWC87904.1 hypothetical protein AEJ54_25230 [Azospirillum sp. Sp 7]ALJ36004.1 hypothetical protein AMK58_11560 [Azospirillum brasilense]MDW7552419.1 hypothetical protein [Azospirillum brasilense]MDW7592391.1 hypothetical protein [Azospirillum brasilense]MDW7627521.1 hypothetical protein [Azospirillum brasilense]
MYYSEMSGPTGTTTTVLQQANNAKKATESKAADGAKAAATTADAATPAKSASPAYTISQSMENLLDNLSGKKPAAAGADAGAAGDAAAGGKTGSQAMADRAKQAEQIMQKALEQSKGLSGLFEKAIDNMAGDLGSLLGGLGMSDDDVKGAVGDFGSAMKDKLKSMDFSQMGMSMQEARSQWSIESRGMELTIQDGDKSVRISFAKSTLDFTREDRGLAATLNGDGSGSAMFSAATTKVSGKATGMIVRANGFSDDEIKGVLEKLNGIAAKGGMKGLGALTPTKSADGVMHLNLDLSQPIPGLTDGSAAKGAAAADTAQKVDITA